MEHMICRTKPEIRLVIHCYLFTHDISTKKSSKISLVQVVNIIIITTNKYNRRNSNKHKARCATNRERFEQINFAVNEMAHNPL